MKNLKITFEIDKIPFYFSSVKDGRKTFEAQAFDGVLTVSVQYDYNRRPLDMNCSAGVGDTVTVILLDYRTELYINGKLRDEEWPFGKRLFNHGDGFFLNSNVVCEEYTAENEEQPSIISSFENAEGWRPEGEVFVGDCMPYRKDNEYHVLYLKDRHHHRSKWGMGAHQWEHISTKDFKTWYVHPMAVPITESWEGSICTGSWIKKDEKEYLYYTVRRGGGQPALICRSVSDDGYHFEKDRNFGFTLSEKYDGASARDPKVILGEDGAFHMFLTTSLVEENKGCLAHYVSYDMENWTEFEKPIYVVPNSDQPECSDYFKYKGKYYLIFSLRGRARYMISNNPFDGFVMPSEPLIPCGGVPKAAEWNGKLIFTGFNAIGGYAGTLTFKSATATDIGELVFENI